MLLIFLIGICFISSNHINLLKYDEKEFKKNLRKNLISKTFKNLRKNEELSNDIAIIHINDVHCHANNTIGYDGFVLYKKELQKKYQNVITIDAGDHIQGGTLGAVSNGEAIIKIMNKVNFDVSTIGNHEFDYGIKQLLKLEEELNSKYICANFLYHKNKTNIFPPYKIIEAGTKKIAFIGTVTPYTFYKSSLSNIKDSNGDLIYDLINDSEELYNKLQSYINEVKKEKNVDYTILLTHFGMNGTEPYSSNLLLSKLEGIDAVIDGHTHLVYNTTTKDKNNKNIKITQTGTKLENIGLLLIKSDNSIISEIISEIPEPKDKKGTKKIKRGDKEIWVDSEMNEFINNIWNEYSEVLNSHVGYVDFNFTINKGDSHDVTCRIEECPIGNLATDAFKEEGNADCVIWTGNTFKNNIYKGNITKGDIINAMPYFNNIFIKKLSGQIILDVLEAGISKLPNSFSQFPQVSGINFYVNTSIKSPIQTDENGIYKGIKGPRRVSDVKINGKKIETNKIYKVALSDYISNGGNGIYKMLSDYEVYNQSLLTDNDALNNFISIKLNGVIPSKYKIQQGRINIDGKNPNCNSKNHSNSNHISRNIFLSIASISIIILFIIMI